MAIHTPSIQLRDRVERGGPFVRNVVRLGSLAAAVVLYSAMALFWLLARPDIGHDFEGYSQGFQRWLHTGSPYAAFELAGPFAPHYGDFIHPPSFLALVGPFSLLPFPINGILWDAIPVVLLLILLRRIPWWAYPVAVALAFSNDGQYILLNGNSSLWFAAAFGWALRFGWPAGLLAMKPSLAPLLLAGVRRPYLAVALAVVPIVVTLPLWPDYLTVVRNSQVPWYYSLAQWPLFVLAALPVLCRAAEQAPKTWRERLRPQRASS